MDAMTFRRILVGACAVVLLLVMQLWIFLPVVPRSILGAVVLVALGLPVSLLIEWMGDAALDRRAFHRLSSPTRVLVAVPVVLAIAAVAAVLVWAVRLAVAAA